MDNIVSYKLKKEFLSYDERSILLSTAMLILKGVDGEYMPTLKEVGFKIAVLIAYFDFYNDKEEVVDILEQLDTSGLYELIYKFDYNELKDGLTQRQLKEIRDSFDNLVQYELIVIEIENNRTSKYDKVLDAIMEMFDKYKEFFDNVDVQKLVKDISMINHKLGNVKQEDIVKEIVKIMDVKDTVTSHDKHNIKRNIGKKKVN